MSQPQKQVRDAKNRIMAAASARFLAHGVRSVSLDDIAAEAGVTKKSIYYHFPGKDALVAAWMEAASDATFAATAQLSADPLLAIRQVFAALAPATQQRPFSGCFFLRAALDLPEPDSKGSKVAVTHKHKRRAWFRDQLERAGHPRPEAGAAELSLIWDGALASAVLIDDGTPAEAALRLVDQVLAGGKREAKAL